MKTVFKKFTAFALALTVILSSSTFVHASTATQLKLDKLVDLGVIMGDSNGVNGTDTMTRYRSIVMMLRLQGLEADMNAFNYVGQPTFTDAAGQSEYVQRLMAYLKAHPELGVVGYPDGSFKPLQEISAKEHAKIMLSVLGYTYGTDFSWDSVSSEAVSLGLVSDPAAIDEDTNFTVSDLADITYNGLIIEPKGDSQNLGEKLGFVIQSTALKMTDAKATGTKQVTVSFSKAVADTSAVTFSATRDNINVPFVSTTWNEAKTEATLAVSYKLFEGDYVVTVNNGDSTLVSDTFEVEESHITSIAFPSDYLILSSDSTQVTTNIVIKNQYGEDITDDYTEDDVNVIASQVDAAGTDLTDGKITLTYAAEYDTNDTVTVTVIDPETAVTASKTLTISASVDVASITIGDVTTEEDSTTIQVSDLGATDTEKYWLPITILDQYGNEITTESDLEAALTVISSDEDTFIDSNTNDGDNGDGDNIADLIGLDENDNPVLYLVPGTDVSDGNTTLTIVSKSGKSSTKVVTVVADAEVDTFTVSKPESVIKAGVEVEIPFVAIDQFGSQLVAATDGLAIDSVNSTATKLVLGPADSQTTINVTNGTISASKDYLNDEALSINVTPTSADDKLVLIVTTPTANVQTLTITVNDAPVPQTISGLGSEFYTAMQEGLTQTMDAEDVTMIDQYGDDFDFSTDAPAGYTLTIAADNSNGNVTNVGSDIVVGTTFTAEDDNNGTDKFVLTLKDDSAETIDTYSFTMQNVPLSDINEFGIKNIDKLYTGTDYTFTNNDGTEYDRNVKIYGKKGTTSVLVDQGLLKSVSTTSGLTFADVTFATTPSATDARIEFVNADNTIDTDNADKTATITALVEGDSLVTCTKTVTYSDAAPVAQSLYLVESGETDELSDTTIIEDAADFVDGATLGTDTAYDFYAEDQYGTAADGVITYVVTNLKNSDDEVIPSATTEVSIASDKTITVDGTALVAGDNFTITAIVDGTVKTVQVVIE